MTSFRKCVRWGRDCQGGYFFDITESLSRVSQTFSKAVTKCSELRTNVGYRKNNRGRAVGLVPTGLGSDSGRGPVESHPVKGMPALEGKREAGHKSYSDGELGLKGYGQVVQPEHEARRDHEQDAKSRE